MAGTSSRTTVISLRLPNDVVAIAQRRVDRWNRNGGRYRSVNDYLRMLVIWDMRRSHRKKAKGQDGI
jgi:hypothetical protein